MSRSISYASYQPTRTRPLAPAGPALPSVRDGSTTSVSLLMLAHLTFRIFFLAVKVAMIDRSVFAVLRVGAVCSLAWLPSPPPGTSTFHFFLGRSLGFGGLTRDFYTHLVPHPPGNRHSAAAARPPIFPEKLHRNLFPWKSCPTHVKSTLDRRSTQKAVGEPSTAMRGPL